VPCRDGTAIRRGDTRRSAPSGAGVPGRIVDYDRTDGIPVSRVSHSRVSLRPSIRDAFSGGVVLSISSAPHTSFSTEESRSPIVRRDLISRICSIEFW
jgi:hypothetical protein